jgi:hypothetical protein
MQNEENLVKSKDRVKAHGEIFTPKFLVLKMLNMVPDEVWSDPSKTFLEPSCGNGNFIIEIIRKKLEHGSTIEQAISTTYGVDIQQDNVNECRQRIVEEFNIEDDELKSLIDDRITCGNFLE